MTVPFDPSKVMVWEDDPAILPRTPDDVERRVVALRHMHEAGYEADARLGATELYVACLHSLAAGLVRPRDVADFAREALRAYAESAP